MVQPASNPVPCRDCPIRQRPCFREFTPEELAFVQSFKVNELVFEKGETILVEGTKTAHLYTVLSGWSFRYKLLEDGNRQILNYALPGDFIGLQGSVFENLEHSVECLTRVRACVFPRDKLWHLYSSYPDLAFDVTWLASREESIIGEFLANVGQRRAQARVAYFLLHLFYHVRQSGLAEGDACFFPLTQQHLSDTLGLSLVHTNKTLKRLYDLGTFEWSAQKLRILNEERLIEIAGQQPSPPKVRPFI